MDADNDVGTMEDGASDQPASPTKESPSTPLVRQNMVENAVSFLTHPSVQNSSIGKRIAFLEHKGLNNAEIKVAMKRAGVTADTYTSANSTGLAGLPAIGVLFAGMGASLALLGSRLKERYFDETPKAVAAPPSDAVGMGHSVAKSSPAEWEESVSELKSELRQLKALYLDSLSASRNMPVVGGSRQTDIPAESHIPAWQRSGLNRSQRFAEERKSRLEEEKKVEVKEVEEVEEEDKEEGSDADKEEDPASTQGDVSHENQLPHETADGKDEEEGACSAAVAMEPNEAVESVEGAADESAAESS